MRGVLAGLALVCACSAQVQWDSVQTDVAETWAPYAVAVFHGTMHAMLVGPPSADNDGNVWLSQDSGNSWAKKTCEMTVNAKQAVLTLRAVSYFDASSYGGESMAVAVGDVPTGSTLPNIMQTYNSGGAWWPGASAIAVYVAPAHLHGVACWPSAGSTDWGSGAVAPFCFAVGESGVIYKRDDVGDSIGDLWFECNAPGQCDGSRASSSTLRGVAFMARNSAIIVGDNTNYAAALATSDGGITWVSVDPAGLNQPGDLLAAVCSTSSSTALAVGVGGKIYAFTLTDPPQADQWVERTSPTIEDLQSVTCTGSECYAVGKNTADDPTKSVIIWSADGGASWTLMAGVTIPGSKLDSVAFGLAGSRRSSETTEGLAVGNVGTILAASPMSSAEPSAEPTTPEPTLSAINEVLESTAAAAAENAVVAAAVTASVTASAVAAATVAAGGTQAAAAGVGAASSAGGYAASDSVALMVSIQGGVQFGLSDAVQSEGGDATMSSFSWTTGRVKPPWSAASGRRKITDSERELLFQGVCFIFIGVMVPVAAAHWLATKLAACTRVPMVLHFPVLESVLFLAWFCGLTVGICPMLDWNTSVSRAYIYAAYSLYFGLLPVLIGLWVWIRWESFTELRFELFAQVKTGIFAATGCWVAVTREDRLCRSFIEWQADAADWWLEAVNCANESPDSADWVNDSDLQSKDDSYTQDSCPARLRSLGELIHMEFALRHAIEKDVQEHLKGLAAHIKDSRAFAPIQKKMLIKMSVIALNCEDLNRQRRRVQRYVLALGDSFERYLPRGRHYEILMITYVWVYGLATGCLQSRPHVQMVTYMVLDSANLLIAVVLQPFNRKIEYWFEVAALTARCLATLVILFPFFDVNLQLNTETTSNILLLSMIGCRGLSLIVRSIVSVAFACRTRTHSGRMPRENYWECRRPGPELSWRLLRVKVMILLLSRGDIQLEDDLCKELFLDSDDDWWTSSENEDELRDDSDDESQPFNGKIEYGYEVAALSDSFCSKRRNDHEFRRRKLRISMPDK